MLNREVIETQHINTSGRCLNHQRCEERAHLGNGCRCMFRSGSYRGRSSLQDHAKLSPILVGYIVSGPVPDAMGAIAHLGVSTSNE